VKIIFFGSTEFSLPIVQRIYDEFSIMGVVISKPKPKGRGLRTALPGIGEWARNMDLQLHMPDDPNSSDFINVLRAMSPDLYVLSAYGYILSKQLLGLPRLGGINIHPSLLPRYRGAAPIQRAIMGGEEKTGVTIFFMDERIDHGDMIAQQEIAIDHDDDSSSLSGKLSRLGAQMIVDAIHKIESGNYSVLKQQGAVSYAPKIRKDELIVTWQGSAKTIYDRIRALAPSPGARTHFRKSEITITSARLGNKKLPAGLLTVENKRLYIGTGDGSLQLLEVKPEGRKTMSALDFINGYRIKEGESVE